MLSLASMNSQGSLNLQEIPIKCTDLVSACRRHALAVRTYFSGFLSITITQIYKRFPVNPLTFLHPAEMQALCDSFYEK